MNLAAYQEAQLTAAVEATGRLRELAYYHAVMGDKQKLSAVLDGASGAQDDSGLLRALRLVLAPDALDTARDVGIADPDPWPIYTVVKCLLRQGRLTDAARAATDRVQSCPTDMASLNLAAKHCTQCGDWAKGAELARLSLSLNPRQEDIRLLLDRAEAGEPWPRELYLDALPKPQGLAFYVPVYNVERYIEGALQGVFRQSYPLSECLVVDDGTEDNSIAIARQFPVRIIAHDQNKGLAAARNTAFVHAASEYVGAVDSDAYPDLSFSRLLMMEFENGAASLAGAGGNLVELHTDTPADRWRARHLAQQGESATRTVSPDFLYGSNTIFHRESVLSAGGYDEQYRTNFEDVNIARRLKAMDKMLVHLPEAKAWHLRRDTVDSVLRTRWGWMLGHYREDRKFLDEASYVKYFNDLLSCAISTLEKDIADEQYDLLYLDFLMFFYDVFLSINLGVRDGVFQAADARAMQLHLAAGLQIVDQRYGGDLRAKLLKDTAALFQKVDGNARPSEGFGEKFAVFLGAYRNFMNDIPESFYRIVSQ